MAHSVAKRPQDEAWRRDEGCLPPASDWVDTMVLELGSLAGGDDNQPGMETAEIPATSPTDPIAVPPRADLGSRPTAPAEPADVAQLQDHMGALVSVLKDICAHFDAEPVDTGAVNGQQTIALTQALGLRREFIRLSGVINRIGESAMPAPQVAGTGAMPLNSPDPDLAAAIPGDI